MGPRSFWSGALFCFDSIKGDHLIEAAIGVALSDRITGAVHYKSSVLPCGDDAVKVWSCIASVPIKANEISPFVRQQSDTIKTKDDYCSWLFGKGNAGGVALAVVAVAGVAFGLYGAVSRPCQRRL